MCITIIPVLYQDQGEHSWMGGTFRAWSQIVAVGVLTEDLTQRLTRTLSSTTQRGFIPEQVGLRHLGWTEPTFTTFPNKLNDHPWHELLLEQVLTVTDDNPLAAIGMHFDSVQDLVIAFEDAAQQGWSANSFDPCGESHLDGTVLWRAQIAAELQAVLPVG